MNLKTQSRERVTKWLFTGETGLSSKALCAVAMGVELEFYNYPLDPADFRRCMKFLSLLSVRETKEILEEIALKNDAWKAIRDNFEELSDLWIEECDQQAAPKLYARMKELGL